MCHVAWQTLEHDFGRTGLVKKAQLKKINEYTFIKPLKPHHSMEVVIYSPVVLEVKAYSDNTTARLTTLQNSRSIV